MSTEKQTRINGAINVPEVRLIIDETSEQLGVVSIREALARAEELQLDLVEISPNANPPVCKIMDFGKFKYYEQKKAHAAKQNQKQVHVKEIKFRPVTDDHDYEIKMRNAKRFLEDGDKVKFIVQFRGREMAHQELGLRYFFANYFLHMSDVTFDMSNNQMTVHNQNAEAWRVTLVDTGDDSMTGGRLARVKDYVKDEDAFCFTYGDGVSDVNIRELIAYHHQHGKLATLTAVTPPGRFGALDIHGGEILSFKEKPKGDGALINGGFFVLSPKVIDLVDSDSCIWEQKPLEHLARNHELMAFDHDGFWQPMDTLRDKNHLEELWSSNKAPWKLWK